MNLIKLTPGWLQRQMDASKAEVATWPKSLLPLLSINEELRHKASASVADDKNHD